MPKDDQVFLSDMSAGEEAFNEASAKCLGWSGSWMQDEVDSRNMQFSYYHRYFRDLGRISGGTEPVVERIKLRIKPRLEKYEKDNNEGPIQVIRGKLEGWKGPQGSASYAFKWNYLPKLAAAMENEYSVMQAMGAVMITHEGVIDQARQKYLDLLESTTTAFDESVEQRERASSAASMVVNVVTAIATGVTIGVAAGPIAGAAFGTIQGIGSMLDATSTDASGDGWFEITDDALAKLEALQRAVEEESGNVESALDEVLVYVDGEFRDQFLAPEVNPGGPPPKEDSVPPIT